MAKRHVMTAARKRALRKAQLASAKKRRKGRVRRTIGAARKEASRKTSYGKKHYRKKPGGFKRQYSDMYHSRGAYSRNWRGKKYGKKMKRVNRIATGIVLSHPLNASIYGVSHLRGKRAMKRKRRR